MTLRNQVVFAHLDLITVDLLIDLQMQEKNQEKIMLESKLKRNEESYRREKEAFESSVASYAAELDAIETKLIRLRDTAAIDVRLNVANRKIAEIQSTRQLRVLEHKRQTREMNEEIMDAVALCASHRELVKEAMEELVPAYRRKLEHMLTSDEPVTGFTPFLPKQTVNHMNTSLFAMGRNATHEKSRSVMGFDNLSPIAADRAGDENETMSYVSHDTSDCAIATNISRAAPEMDPRRVVSNLAGLINKCAADDRNLLDDSASCVEI